MVQSLPGTFGSVFIEGYTAVNKIDNLVRMPIMNIGIVVQNDTAQNISARKMDRVKEGFKAGSVILDTFYLMMTVSLIISITFLVDLFLDEAAYLNEIAAGAYYSTHIALFFVGRVGCVKGIRGYERQTQVIGVRCAWGASMAL